MQRLILFIWCKRFAGARAMVIRQKSVLVALLVVALATVTAVTGRAQASALPGSGSPPRTVVIYSNLGPGSSYDPWDSWCVYVHPFPPANPALCPPSPQGVAMAFTGNGGHVTRIDLGLTWEGSGADTATVQLATDTGYPNPGQQLLGSWQVANLPLIYGCPCGLTTIDVSPSIRVAAGRRYWVIVRPGTDSTVVAWNHTYDAAQGLVATYPDWRGGWGFSWDAPLSAFDVIGCPTQTAGRRC